MLTQWTNIADGQGTNWQLRYLCNRYADEPPDRYASELPVQIEVDRERVVAFKKRIDIVKYPPPYFTLTLKIAWKTKPQRNERAQTAFGLARLT